MKGPPRLSSEGGRLGEAVNDLRRQTPDFERLSRMAQALSAQGVDVRVDPSAHQPPAAPELTGKVGSSTAAKLGIGAGIGGLLALGLAALLQQTPTGSGPVLPSTVQTAAEPAAAPISAAASPAPPSPRSAAAAPTELVPVPAEVTPAPGAAVDPAERAPAPGQTARTPAAAVAAPSSAETPAPTRSVTESRTRENRAAQSTNTTDGAAVTAESEISLLKRAREALAGNPATALALAEQHRERYPSGRLAQEREVIAITALARLGQPTSARARAERFERAYPGSAYASQIRRVVGDE